jgi:hypothetical protein
MKENIYQLGKDESIKLEIPLDPVSNSPKFYFEGFSIALVGNRLQFVADKNTEAVFLEIEQKCESILHLLAQTPFFAIGINHTFSYEEGEFDFNAAFPVPERGALAPYGSLNPVVTRSITVGEDQTVTLTFNGDSKRISYNFNQSASTPLKAQTLFETPGVMAEKKRDALLILSAAYSLNLD